ncbi:MAG: hypothetical protein CSA82_02800 [Actinobacteria bacterium]|nr:MAG: hypothetical protein CSA82_02800 [Actinomycetota bacterium]
MKLRSLTLAGVGPFHHRTHIDFSLFDDSGIFLLSGPTGAGKSTIIDALTFALYGGVARQKDASKDRLRSTYCEPEDPSYVELVFEVSSGLYKVKRTPHYVKPGRKTPVNATVRLMRVTENDDGTYVPVESGDSFAVASRSLGEVDTEIVSLLGLKKDQFLQTVVLPQGKFATFLTARSDDRREILQDIFDTSVYQRMENYLRELVHHYNTQVSDARKAFIQQALSFDQLVARFENARKEKELLLTDLPDEELRSDRCTRMSQTLEDTDATIISPYVELADAIHQEALAVGKRSQDARTREKEARQEFQEALTTIKLLDERQELTHTLALCEAEADDIAAQRAKRDTAQRAAATIVALDHAQEAHMSMVKSYEALEEAAKQLPTTAHLRSAWTHAPDIGVLAKLRAQADSSPHETVQSIRHAIEVISTERQRIRELVECEKGFPDRTDKIEALRHSLEEKKQEISDLATLLDAIPQRLEDARNNYTEKTRAGHEISVWKERLATRKKKLAHAKEAASKRLVLAEAQDALRAAVDNAQAAGRQAEHAHHQWLEDSAAAIASTLSQGDPCPVCGSLDHPSPAEPRSDEGVSLDTVRSLDNARHNAEKEVEEHRGELSSLTEHIRLLEEQAGASLDALTTEYTHCESQLRAAHTAQEEAQELAILIERLQAEHTTLNSEISRHREEYARSSEHVLALETELKADRDRCEKAAGDSSLSSIDHTLSEAVTKLHAYNDALNGYSSAVELEKQADATQRKSLESYGFTPDAAGAKQAREACLSPEEIAALDKAITSADELVRSTRSRLESDEIRSVASVSRPDSDLYKTTYEQWQEKAETLTREAGAAAELDENARQALTLITDSLSALRHTMDEARPASRLAALATASSQENLADTPLGAWVLMSRFEEVLEAANPRLQAISNGRYALKRTQDDGTRSKKSGLGLLIVDYDTDHERTPSTLSGGEMFYVSLSLALGLADIVTAESGGVELHTMFVDEGFGSLDSSTLDMVMDQLMDLRESGRTVGVISHVHEMASRISDQITISWTPKKGSTACLRGA